MFGLRKILNVEQIRSADLHAIKSTPIASLQLMENASNAFVEAVKKRIGKGDKIAVLCGIGNNGGDGLAAARILISGGYQCTIYLIKFSVQMSNDCQSNLDKLPSTVIVKEGDKIPELVNYDVIIDALLGSGVSKVVEGFLAEVIENINRSDKTVISIDVPSGLSCDEIPLRGPIVNADLVVTFQRPKRSFFFPESALFVKNWVTVDIGLDEEFIQDQASQIFELDENIANSVKTRKRQSHKGSYGHALIIAGSYGKIGASVLSSQACLRSGAGLLTSYVPNCGYQIFQTAVPEAMVQIDNEQDFIGNSPATYGYNSIGIGPGLGQHRKTFSMLKRVLESAQCPLVIDADALNIMSEDESILSVLPENSLLTPHPKEFERLVGTWKNSEERLEKQIRFSSENNCIVILKDASTCIVDQTGNVFYNTSGNPGMATGGSGDVLTGVLTGLLCQGYNSLEAALIGVYFHGKAGDSAAQLKGQNGVIASDIIANLRIESGK